MCVQTITTEQDCLYLDYLNNCGPDRAYPPLRMYETADFVFINAEDSNQISIAKVNFIVDINGVEFTDKNLAMAELAVQIGCVNSSATGGGGGTPVLPPNASTETKQDNQISNQLNQISNQLSQITEAELTNENLRKKGVIPTVTPFVDFASPQVGGPIAYPLTVNSLWFTLNPINVNRSAGGATVNNISELVDLWNGIMPENEMVVRDANTAWLLPGTEPVTALVGDGYTIDATSGFRIWSATSFGSDTYDLPEDPISNLDCILLGIDRIEKMLSSGTSGPAISVAASTSSVVLKPSNEDRKSLKILNESSSVMYVQYTVAASVATHVWRLEQYEGAIIDDFNGIVTGIWDTASGFAQVTEVSH